MGKLSNFSIDFVQESTIFNLLTRSVSISSSISLYLANARLPSLCPDNLPIIQFYKSLYITTIPTFSHINSDVQSEKFNKNSDEYHARTYIYSDEKRKTARIILPLILQASYRDDIYSICPTICILSSG